MSPSALAVIVILAAGACADPVAAPPAEPAEALASHDAALDTLDGDVYLLSRDVRRCAFPYCGGFWVEKLNWSRMRCADGAVRERCYVAGLDMSALGYGGDWERKVVDDLAAGRGLVRGGFAPFDPAFPKLAALEVAAAYEPVTGREVRGHFFRLGDNGVRCVTRPCLSTDIELVNWPLSGRLAELDRDDVPASVEMDARVAEALAAQTLFAAGSLYLTADGGLGLDAEMLYVPYLVDRRDVCGRDEVCEPGQVCLEDPRVPEVTGLCATVASVTELVASPKAYDGQLVAVRGDAHQGLGYCTQRACSPDAPCCNACGGEQRLFESAEELQGGIRLLEGDTYLRCGGNECTTTCDREAGPYLVVGTFGLDEWGTPQLDLEAMTRL